jgi:shikimate kinase
MGSGKTTIGKMLANRLNYSFVDMDARIEEQQFKSINDIFNEVGENEFRVLEKKCLHEVAEFTNVIISTGGGAPCFFDNINYMNSKGLTIYLKLTTEELAIRLESFKVNKRPLLANKNANELRQFIADGLLKREPFYNQATLSLHGSEKEIVNNICDYVKLN